MRISDWSSDVCSSDLTVDSGAGATRRAGARCPCKCRRASRRCGRRTGGCGTRPRGRGRAACRITSERPDGVAVRPFSLPRRVIMADRVSASIAIGGKVSPTQLAELAAHIAEYELRIEWAGEPFDPQTLPQEEHRASTRLKHHQ